MENISPRKQKALEARKTRERAALKRAIAVRGGICDFAIALSDFLVERGEDGITYQSIQRWVKKGIPRDRIEDTETVCYGVVQCEELDEGFTRRTARPYGKKK